MIDYTPLWHTLIDKGLKKTDVLRQTGISSSTLTKMNRNEYVALEVIEKICLAIDCKIEDVVRIEKSPDG
jgi:DNA-binding Xre family transcriptional regulator